MRRVLALRPEPGLSQTLAAGQAMGLEITGAPLFQISPTEWDAPEAEQFDGLLVGSANVFRHGGAALEGLRGLPVHAVGETTAALARDAGFEVAQIGHGGLQNVLDALAGRSLRLLRLAGRDRVALETPAEVTMDERIVYSADPVALDQDTVRLLRQDPVVLLHSARAAEHFASECARLSIARGKIAVAALGPRISEAAGAGWLSLRTAPVPQDAALLAMARQMCQD